MKIKSYDRFFMNFAHPVRMKIITLLMNGSLSVNEICEKTGEEQSNVSHHLTGMTRCNIVNVERKGKKRVYSLNSIVVNPIFKMVESHIHSSCNDCKGGCSECHIGK